MRGFEIVQSDTDTTTSHAGLALVGRALGHTRLRADLDGIALCRFRRIADTHSDAWRTAFR